MSNTNIQYLAACLLLASTQTIGTAAAMIGGYNAPPTTTYDNNYYAQIVFLVLACLGFIYALYVIMNPNAVSANVLLSIAVIWVGVTFTSTTLAMNYITNQQTQFIIAYAIAGVVVLLGGYSYMNISK